MKNVTEFWRRRDGKPLIAVYDDGKGLLQIVAGDFTYNNRDGTHHSQYHWALLPVPREPTYRPFRDLAEAFSVMGPTPFMRFKVGEGVVWWLVTLWDVTGGAIARHSLAQVFHECEWTNNPSNKTGKVCGVEVKRMTDSEIKQNIEFVFRTLKDCDNPEHAEWVRQHWAEMSAKWCQEIADEMKARIERQK
jgi:hypothetical protein